MSINAQLTATALIHHGTQNRMLDVPDPGAYFPTAVKIAMEDYVAVANKDREESAAAEQAEQDALEQACATAWANLLKVMAEHQDETLARATKGRRAAVQRLRELAAEVEDVACDYAANVLIEMFPGRPELPSQFRSEVPGLFELSIGLDGAGATGGLRQALTALNGA